MRSTFEALLYWMPRVMGLALAIFTAIFSFDVLSMGLDLAHTLLALAIHLIPALLVLGAVLIGWRWEAVGGGLFILLGLLYYVVSGPKFPLSVYLIFMGIPALIGLLFFWDWWYRRQRLVEEG